MTNPEVITIKTKSKLDGKTVERSAQYANLSAADIAALITTATPEMQTFVAECYHLGATSRLRNCINRDATAQYNGEAITPAMLLEMQQQAEESRTSNAAGLEAFRTCVSLLVEVASKSNMSASGCDKVRKLVSNPVGLSVASASVKARISAIMEALQAALDDEALEAIAAPMAKLTAAIETSEDDAEW